MLHVTCYMLHVLTVTFKNLINRKLYLRCFIFKLESGQTGKETDNDINDGESEAFKQLLYTTKGYRSQWRTKIENWIFNLLNRNNEKLKLTRDDLFARFLKL